MPDAMEMKAFNAIVWKQPMMACRTHSKSWDKRSLACIALVYHATVQKRQGQHERERVLSECGSVWQAFLSSLPIPVSSSLGWVCHDTLLYSQNLPVPSGAHNASFSVVETYSRGEYLTHISTCTYRSACHLWIHTKTNSTTGTHQAISMHTANSLMKKKM